MDALRGGFGTIGSIIRARSARKKSMSDGPPGSEAFRHRHSYASGAERHLNAEHLMPGVQRHQLWDAPVPGSRPSDSVERISMQPPRQHHRSIRFGDEPVEVPGKEHESSIQSLNTPTAHVTNTALTSSPPAVRYDGLPPSSTPTASPFEVIDPFTDDTKTARPVDYNSPSLESPSSDSLDQRQTKSTRAHLYPRRSSDSDREESVSLVANHDGSTAKGRDIRLVKRT